MQPASIEITELSCLLNAVYICPAILNHDSDDIILTCARPRLFAIGPIHDITGFVHAFSCYRVDFLLGIFLLNLIIWKNEKQNQPYTLWLVINFLQFSGLGGNFYWWGANKRGAAGTERLRRRRLREGGGGEGMSGPCPHWELRS